MFARLASAQDDANKTVFEYFADVANNLKPRVVGFHYDIEQHNCGVWVFGNQGFCSATTVRANRCGDALQIQSRAIQVRKYYEFRCHRRRSAISKAFHRFY